MTRLLNEWLFAGITASTALMSICALDPRHPLATVARSLGYGLALLCVLTAVLARWLRSRQTRERR